jgi:hypothetical protein
VGQQGSYLLPPSKKIGDNVANIPPGGVLVPDIWSEELLRRFKENMTLKPVFDPPFIRLGPNIALSEAQVMAAIHAPDTDPIIRDALIAYCAKMRITVKEPDRINVGKIYGYKTVRYDR